MKSKQELVDLLWLRTGISRAELSTRTVEELETILTDHHLAQIRAEAAQAAEAADEELVRVQAEREADRVLHELHLQQGRELQRTAEDKRQLIEDRKTFLEACRQFHIGCTDANFSLIRTLGPGFSAYEIGQAVLSGKLHVSPATPEEIQEWTQEAQEQRQQNLRNLSLEELRSVVRNEAESRRAEAERAEQEVQVAHREALDAQIGFPPLPEINAATGEKLSSAYFIRLSNTDLQRFKTYIRQFGASQITRALRERV